MLIRRLVWFAVITCVLGAGVAAAMLKKQNAPEKSAAPVVQTPAALEFLPDDVTTVQVRDLRQLLSLTGTLRAVNQATVKAKVPGEVRDVLVREGEPVKDGQVVIRMDPSDYQARVEQAKGALQAARGQLDIAAQTRNNNKALLAKGFISKNAFDNAESQFAIARANVNSARGALDVAQKALADTVIRAPIPGLVSSRTVQPGEKVSADNHLLDVIDLSQMEMEAAVPASEIARVALEQEVRVTVEGVPHPLRGSIARINPATQAGSRSILVYIRIDNPQHVLRAGMFGEAEVTIAKKSGVLTIPRSAIRTEAGAPYVYGIENGRLTQKPVTLGMKGDNGNGDAVEIVKGLDAGERIVKTNLGSLRTGAAIRITTAGNAAPSIQQ